MNSLKQGLLQFYCTVTAAHRQRRVAQLIEFEEAPIAILFYHRVADLHPNDWTMPTSVSGAR